MHDSFLMHMLQCARYLMYVFDDAFLLKIDLILHGLLDDKLKVSFLCPFDCNEKFIQFIVNEPAQIFDDVCVI